MAKVTEAFTESALRKGIIVIEREMQMRNGLMVSKAPETGTEASQAVIYASVIELANLGFQVDPSDLRGFVTVQDLTKVIESARKIVGSDRDTTPVYPGFPKQVQELSTLTLLVEQLMHYWSNGSLIPDYPNTVRGQISLEDIARLAPRELKVMDQGTAAEIFVRDLTTDNISLSDSDKELLQNSVDNLTLVFGLSDISLIVRNSKNAENIQSLLIAMKNKLNDSVSLDEMAQTWIPEARNVDELLRMVLALTTSPVEGRKVEDYENAVRNLNDKFAKNVRMVNVSRQSRRVILQRLSKVSEGFNADSIIAHRNLWRRVMRMVHPYSMKLDANAKRAVDIIHENIEYRTYNSLVEDALARKDVREVVKLVSKNQPGNLLRRLVSLLRMAKNAGDVHSIIKGLQVAADKSRLTTLISAYNGVLVANSDSARVTRVAGLNNTLVEKTYEKIDEDYILSILEAVRDAIRKNLSLKNAPVGIVGVLGDQAVSLVNRDASTTDRVMDRGEKLAISGEGDTIRLFNHWRNNQNREGYIDTGVVVLDENFKKLAVVTWNSWSENRKWSTYSGDTLVHVGKEAVEYIDVNVKELKKIYSDASWLVMTLQSYSGFPMANVDLIAGAMLRSKPDSGEAFDARTLATAFKPTTSSLQSIPLAVDLSSGDMLWVDSSSGSTQQGVSAVSDETVGTILYDEIVRPRLTVGDLANLWAEAHEVEVDKAKAVDKDAVMSLLQ